MRFFKHFHSPRVSFKQFRTDLMREISEDNVSNGAAALAYYLTLAIFPSMLFLLAVIPYLPIAHLDREIMGLLNEALPGDAAAMFQGVVTEITQHRKGGLLSFGLLFTLWAASNGIYAVMRQLNITYGVKEERGFFKVRFTAIGLTLAFGLLIVLAMALVMLGGSAIDWATQQLGLGAAAATLISVGRYGVVALAIMLALAVVYSKGPDTDQSFKFVTPGSVLGTALFGVASAGLKFYVSNFGSYDATYGSIGAVIVLMLWLYATGLIILLGSEVNALIEHYSPEGKEKGEKKPGDGRRGLTVLEAKGHVP